MQASKQESSQQQKPLSQHNTEVHTGCVVTE